MIGLDHMALPFAPSPEVCRIYHVANINDICSLYVLYMFFLILSTSLAHGQSAALAKSGLMARHRDSGRRIAEELHRDRPIDIVQAAARVMLGTLCR
ncbi:hypothetical protein [Novosphingobium sp. SG919]|uniref:hypothetical protein n=1 Tax=Novosphingobium sp. SG919 TaxID=2587133 RepID=UPI00146EB6A9|nr:hypothetical protein [Novosphingobium sp. SG919]